MEIGGVTLTRKAPQIILPQEDIFQNPRRNREPLPTGHEGTTTPKP